MKNLKMASIESTRGQKSLISFGLILMISALLIVFFTSCDTSINSAGNLNIEKIDNADENLTEIFDLIINRFYEAKEQIEILDHKIHESENITDNFSKLNGFDDIDEYYIDLEIFTTKVKDLGIEHHVKDKEGAFHLSDSLLNLVEDYISEEIKIFNQKTNLFSNDESECNYGYGDCMEAVIITYFVAVATSASKACYKCLFYAEAGLWVGIMTCERAYNRCIDRIEEA